MGLSWALGHMITAGLLIMLLEITLLDVIVSFFGYFEIAVGLMLIFLGGLSIAWETKSFHTHKHEHENTTHTHSHVHVLNHERHLHPHLFTAGIIQGLASNDEILTLIVISLGVITLPEMFLNLGIFTTGVALGMLTFGFTMSYPVMRFGIRRVKKVIGITVGSVSILYGLLLIIGLV